MEVLKIYSYCYIRKVPEVLGRSMVKTTRRTIYSDTAANRRTHHVDKVVEKVDNVLQTNMLPSDNAFSIDNVNTLNYAYLKCMNKLNFTVNLINEKETEIIGVSQYASVLRPIFEKKYTDNAISIDGYIDIARIEPVNPALNKLFMTYFHEPDVSRDNKTQWDDKLLNDQRYKAGADLYDETTTLRKHHPNQSKFYVINWYKWKDSVKVSFSICIPDILNPTGPWIRILSGVNITPYFPPITSIELIPQSYQLYLGKLQDIFNNYVNVDYDASLGTIYQFGSNQDFSKLKVVSSQDYPAWDGGLIVDSYIPGSNINMPNIVYQINIQLNRQYTGMSAGEIVIVQYDIGHVYYNGVVKMLQVDGYDGLCYQIQPININETFPTSIRMVGDVNIQGNLNVLNYNDESVISSDNTRKVVSIHDKVGINQQPHEVDGLLDIDNLTQQGVLDLFDSFVPYVVNSSDVIKTISAASASLPPGTPIEQAGGAIKQLFSQGFPLFDYKDQCTIFAVPIKSIISRSEVLIIHTDDTVVGDGDDGLTASGRAASIITSESSLSRLQQVIKEINQMVPEIMKANDPSFVFSFVELLTSLDTQSYMTSSSVIIFNGLAVFAMTYLDVTSTMNDNSTGKPFIKIMDYVSRETRFVNYVSLLFKDTDLIDADGNYSVDGNGNTNLQNTIRNNPYFSNRFDLLPESYLFSFNEDENSRYIIMEGAPQWNKKMPYDVWSGDNNVQIVIDLILEQRKVLYNDRKNSVFSVNYRWRGGRKISFINTINIGNTTVWLGSGFDLNSMLDESLLVRGDNTLTGNFYVNDANNNNIFKVDNVNKTITNTYKVGIGVEKPRSVLDVKDTTVSDILSELDYGNQQYNILNKIAKNLRTVAAATPLNNSNVRTVIDNVYQQLSIEQTIENYARFYEVNMETMLVDDMKVMRQWLYPGWEGKKLGELDDDPHQFGLKVAKQTLSGILQKETIYDTGLSLSIQRYVFGWRFVRTLMLGINGKMYFLLLSTNIQSYGLRPDSNANITKSLTIALLGNIMTNRMYCLMNSITPVNNIEGFNELVRLEHENNDITLSTFILTVDTSNISAITKQEIALDTDTLTLNTGNIVSMDNFNEYNELVKYKNFWVKLNNKNYYDNMSIHDFNVITYEDSYSDFITGIKCIGISGSTITFLCNEVRIQDIIIPSLSVQGDAKITGDLMITSSKYGDDTNYVSIDPDNNFMGIGTDERFINYQDRTYTTTDSVFAGRHNVYVNHDKYPVMVIERIRELPQDQLNNNFTSFRSYSTLTAKRKSKLYDFDEIYQNINQYEVDFKNGSPNDKVSHMKYGPDISFEVCDKTDRTVELGQLGMNIDSMGQDGYLRGGFGVHVFDPEISNSTITTKRSIMYVDNDSQLFVQKINLNGGVLTTDDGTNLFWNGEKLNK